GSYCQRGLGAPQDAPHLGPQRAPPPAPPPPISHPPPPPPARSSNYGTVVLRLGRLQAGFFVDGAVGRPCKPCSPAAHFLIQTSLSAAFPGRSRRRQDAITGSPAENGDPVLMPPWPAEQHTSRLRGGSVWCRPARSDAPGRPVSRGSGSVNGDVRS